MHSAALTATRNQLHNSRTWQGEEGERVGVPAYPNQPRCFGLNHKYVRVIVMMVLMGMAVVEILALRMMVNKMIVQEMMVQKMMDDNDDDLLLPPPQKSPALRPDYLKLS